MGRDRVHPDGFVDEIRFGMFDPKKMLGRGRECVHPLGCGGGDEGERPLLPARVW